MTRKEKANHQQKISKHDFPPWSETGPVVYDLGVQFVIRIVLAVITTIYFCFMPAPPLFLKIRHVILLALIYATFHLLWFIYFKRQEISNIGIRIANLMDLVCAGFTILFDPYSHPVGLVLLLIAVIGNGIQHGLKYFKRTGIYSLLILIVVTWIRSYVLLYPPSYGYIFYTLYLSTCAVYVFILIHRIDELKNRAESLAQTDELTGLLNRRAFLHSANYMLNVARRTGMPVVFAIADLDDFKQVNDSHGHHIGDVVLKKLGEMIRENFRQSDLAARFGGDEFIFLFANSNPKDIEKKIETISDLFKRWCASYGISTGISWGTASYDPSSEPDPTDLIVKADQLLYKHKKKKQQGRQ